MAKVTILPVAPFFPYSYATSEINKIIICIQKLFFTFMKEYDW